MWKRNRRKGKIDNEGEEKQEGKSSHARKETTEWKGNKKGEW